MSYSWRNFTVLNEEKFGDGNLNTGDSFVYEGAHAQMWVYDNDGGLAGDRGANERGSDWQPGWVNEDGEWTDAGNVYWEGYFTLTGSDGKTYYLIEIEGTGLDNSQDYFAFYGSVPPQGVTLTAKSYYGDSGSLSYNCLDGGEIGSVPVSPEAANDFLSTIQTEGVDGADINVLLNDKSNTGEALVVKAVDGSANLVGVWVDLDNGGRILMAANGSVDFDADGDFDALGEGEIATVSINYTVLNSDGLTATATLTIEVTGINDAPVAVDQSVRITEDEAATGNVLDGAFDVDGDDVSLDGISLGAIGEEIEVTTANGYTGTIVVNADGTFTYTPGPDAQAMNDGESDSFTFDFTVKSLDSAGTPSVTKTIDFEGFCKGEVITDDIEGVTISAWARGRTNNDQPDEAMIFDSNNPTGGDWDLRTATQNNILIISEDNLSSDPDDNARGGSITFDFDAPKTIDQLTWIDIDHGETNTVKFYDAAGNLITSIDGMTTGDSKQGTQTFDVANVSKMVIEMSGSGAIDDIVYSEPGDAPTYLYDTATVTVNIDGMSDGPMISVANDTNLTDEDTAVSGNLLENDTATGGTLSVTGIEGGAVGQSFEVTSDGGRTGLLVVNADGTYTFTPNDGFEDLNDGESDTITLSYTATATGADSTTTYTQSELGDVVATGDGTQQVIFEGEDAGYRNMLGSYIIDVDGNITGVEILFEDASVDKLEAGVSAAERTFEAGQQVGYFLVQNGFNLNDTAAFTGGAFVMRNADGAPANVDGTGSELFYVKADGTEIAVNGNEWHTVATGARTKLNNDGVEHLYRYVDAGGKVFYGFEDLTDGGDRDYNDTLFSISGSYAVTEGASVSADATLTITVTGVSDNLPPVVQIETNITDENTAVSGNLLDDATDPDGDTITVLSTTAGALGESVSVTTEGGRTGTLVVQADGSYTFTPDGVDLDLGQTDTITFGYTATDGQATASSTAVITITGLNDGPVAMAQSFTISEANDQGLNATAAGNLLDGATDADGDTITVSGISAGALGTAIAVTTAAGAAATLTVNADGSFSLVSADDSMDLGESDSFTFDFTVVSSGGVTEQFDTQTATVTINGVNVGPAAQDIALSMDEAASSPLTPSTVTGDLLADATDADGDTVSLLTTTKGTIGAPRSVTTDGGRTGILEINADGTFTFTSTSDALDITETDTLTFDFTVSSTGGTTVQTDTKTATITINGLNDAPVAISQSVTLNEQNDQGLSSTVSGNLLNGATDKDGDALSLASTTAGIIGQTVTGITTDGGRTGDLTINADGTFTFVSTDASLDKGQTDTLTFDFTVSSTGGAVVQTSTATATININGVNVAPVTVNQTFQIAEANDQGLNNSITGNLLNGATDADGDAVSIFSTSIGAVGETVIVQTAGGKDAELTIDAQGNFTLTALDSSLDLNANDLVAIEFTAVSSGGVTPQFSTSTATINISGVNVAPVAGNITAAIFEQNAAGLTSSVTGSLFAASTDADGDALTLLSTSLGAIGETVEVTTAQGGTGLLTLNADGSYSFVSTSDGLDKDVADSVSFQFTVSSTAGTTVQTSTATATINITGYNAPPVAIDQVYTTDEDTQLANVNILDGSSDADGDVVTLTSLSDGLTISTPGLFQPVVSNPVYTNESGYSGSLVVFTNGDIRFTPSAQTAALMNDGDVETITFNYTVQSTNDTVTQTDTKSVTITITGLDDNNPPVVTDQTITILETEIANGNLSDSVTDPDVGDTYTFTDVAGSAFNPGGTITLTSDRGWTGELTVQADGSFTFDPSEQFLALNDGESELVTFGFEATDAGGLSDAGQVTIVVEGEGTAAPTGADVNYIFLIDTSSSMFVEAPGLDCDENGDTVSSWVDLSIGLAGGLGDSLPAIWESQTNLTTSTAYYTFGDIATEIASPYDIQSTGSSSNLSGALASLQSELDPTKDNQIFVFSGANTSSDGVADEVSALINDFNATVTTYGIGPSGALGGLIDDLLGLAGLGSDTIVIDDCVDVYEEIFMQEDDLYDQLYQPT